MQDLVGHGEDFGFRSKRVSVLKALRCLVVKIISFKKSCLLAKHSLKASQEDNFDT